MMLLLEQTGTVLPLEKEKIQERLKMFDQLWNESPRVQKMKEQFRLQAQKDAEQFRLQAQKDAEQFRLQAQKDAEQKIKDAEQKIRDAEQKIRDAEQKIAEREKQMQDLVEKERAEIRAKAQADIEAKARTDQEAEAKVFRRALISMIHARFPNLTEFAQQQVELFDKPGALDLLIQKIATAPDANAARWLLDSSTATHE